MDERSARPPAGPRGEIGRDAEAAAARHLRRAGWRVIGRNLRLDGVEVDVVAVDPSPPPALVIIEVRARSRPGFGAAIEGVDRAKVARLYRAASAARRSIGTGLDLPGTPRVDLLTLAHRRDGTWDVTTHLRGLEPP